MHKIKLVQGYIHIRTNRAWRQLSYRHEVPEKVLKDQFDYQDPEETTDGFFCYHGTWYHLDQFERVDPEGKLGKDGWGGICTESISSGVLIKLSADAQTYQVASFYTTD